MRERRPARGLLAVLLGLLLIAGLSGCRSDAPRNEGGYVGAAPTVTLVAPADRKPTGVVSGQKLGAFDGAEISSADFSGKVVVINVWGSWCPPCREEAADLQAASERTKDEAAFLGITVKDYSVLAATKFVQEFGITYPSIYDPTGATLLQLAGALPPSAIPTTLVIDTQGRVAARILSSVTEDTLVGIVEDVAAGK